MEKNMIHKLNLQLFATDEAGTGAAAAEGDEAIKDEGQDTPPAEKTFTQKEVDEIVKKRLEREKARQEEEKAEAQRLAAMNEQERQQELIRLKDEEIREKTNQIRMMELKEDTIKTLTEEGLSLSFIDFLMADDAQKTKENIDKFKAVYAAEVQAEVEKRIAGETPKIKETKLEKGKESKTMDEIMQNSRII